jgi:hypothetical protein
VLDLIVQAVYISIYKYITSEGEGRPFVQSDFYTIKNKTQTKFILSIVKQFEETGKLSPKQIDCLTEEYLR